MKTRTVDEILSKIIEMETLQTWLFEVLETKTRPSEIMKTSSNFNYVIYLYPYRLIQIIYKVVIGESKKEKHGTLACFCLTPLSQTYHMLLPSITIIFYTIAIYEYWIQLDSKN
jgi:hypothetical protein